MKYKGKEDYFISHFIV